MLPIVIPCFNNYKYVDQIINNLITCNKDNLNSIIIMDNCSTELETLNFLDKTSVRVTRNKHNNGPWISPENNKEIYDELPDQFIITDPDLELNPNMPSNFSEILLEISEKYSS